jgi:hypothetical protein
VTEIDRPKRTGRTQAKSDTLDARLRPAAWCTTRSVVGD